MPASSLQKYRLFFFVSSSSDLLLGLILSLPKPRFWHWCSNSSQIILSSCFVYIRILIRKILSLNKIFCSKIGEDQQEDDAVDGPPELLVCTMIKFPYLCLHNYIELESFYHFTIISVCCQALWMQLIFVIKVNLVLRWSSLWLRHFIMIHRCSPKNPNFRIGTQAVQSWIDSNFFGAMHNFKSLLQWFMER